MVGRHNREDRTSRWLLRLVDFQLREVAYLGCLGWAGLSPEVQILEEEKKSWWRQDQGQEMGKSSRGKGWEGKAWC